jgi:hypothetical protein
MLIGDVNEAADLVTAWSNETYEDYRKLLKETKPELVLLSERLIIGTF